MRTELGRSQVEVQRCALSWEGPRLRSRRVGKATVDVEVEAEVVEEEEEKEEQGGGGRGEEQL